MENLTAIETFENTILNASYGNLKVLKFKSINRVDLELEKLREIVGEDTSIWCKASERFEEIYNVNPQFLKNELKKLKLNLN